MTNTNQSLASYYSRKAKRQLMTGSLIAVVIVLAFGLPVALVARSRGQVIFLILMAMVAGFFTFLQLTRHSRKWRKILRHPLSESQRKILSDHVDFYTSLDTDGQQYFEQRIQYFLHTKAITPVNCEIDERLILFIAASAIMPVFSFPDFFYRNINEVLVYPDSFDEEYNLSTPDKRRRIAGMVGNGAMNRMMILSKRDLLRAFDDKYDADNLAIHEFVHLIDMADGTTDGIPAVLMEKQFVMPWVSEINREIKRIKTRSSDIDRYSLTNNAEFLAVVSEYFFDTPDQFQRKHPELFRLMSKIFKYRN
jgi:Mlc titration factor MtfA (ptsG expression regulator)